MSEVRGADIGGGEAAAAVEDPCLGVQSGGADVVGDTNLRPQVGELFQRGLFGGSGVDGGEDPQLLAVLAVSAQRGDQRVDAAAADEGHQDVDFVGGFDFGVELVQQPRLAGRIGQQGGVQQWDQRLGDRLRCAVGPAAKDRVQDLARFDRYFGGFGLHDLREPGDEVASHLDADPDSLAVPDRLQRALDAPAQVQRDAVGRLGGVELAAGPQPLVPGLEFGSKCLGDELFVEARFNHAAIPRC